MLPQYATDAKRHMRRPSSQVVLLRKGNQHFVDDPDVTESSRQAFEI